MSESKAAASKSVKNKTPSVKGAVPKKGKEKKAKSKNAARKGKEKRPLGRPRLYPLLKPMARKGISEKPDNDDSHCEFTYSEPILMKKIQSLFKEISVGEIKITFDKTCVKMCTVDKFKKSNVMVVFDGKRVNHYYCKEKSEVFLSNDTLTKVMRVLDKSYTSIKLVSKTKTCRSELAAIFYHRIGINEIRGIKLIQAHKLQCDNTFDDSGYPIKFSLPGKYFKKLITDVSNTKAKFLNIQKVGKGNLTFKCRSDDKTIKPCYVVTDPKSIDLQTTIVDKGDIFSVALYVDYIKPIVTMLPPHPVKISISVHLTKDAIFKVGMDDGALNIFVKTKTVQPDNNK